MYMDKLNSGVLTYILVALIMTGLLGKVDIYKVNPRQFFSRETSLLYPVLVTFTLIILSFLIFNPTLFQGKMSALTLTLFGLVLFKEDK